MSTKPAVLLLLIGVTFVVGGVTPDSLRHQLEGCNNDIDCSLNGHCAAGLCQCYAGWKGSDCGQLNQGKSERIWPAAAPGELDQDHIAASWGGTIVRDPRDNSYHMYNEVVCVKDSCAHTKNGQIVHSTSQHAAGPYQFSDVAISPSASNPMVVYHAPSKHFLLFYSPNPVPPSPTTQCTGAKPGSTTKLNDYLMSSKRSVNDDPQNGGIRLAWATDPAGPWQSKKLSVEGGPSDDVPAANPSAFVFPNGTVSMVFRYNPPSGDPAGEVLAVALAENWDGPYRLISDKLRNKADIDDHRAEDPFIYQDAQTYFHIIYHQYNQTDRITGGHLFSTDLIEWHSGKTAVYDTYDVSFYNGTRKDVDHRERPYVHLQDDGNGLRPVFLLTGMEVGDKGASYPNCYSETVRTDILP